MPTLNLRPGANTDDSHATSTGSLVDSTSLGIGRGADPQRTFYRFPNVVIPKKSKILSATLTVRSDNSRADNINVYVGAVAAANQAAPADRAALFAFTFGTISSLWSFALVNNTNFTSPSVTTLIHEIVNRGCWVACNAIALVSYDNGGQNDYGGIVAYNSDVNNCALLTVTYSRAGNPAPISPFLMI
jgi:hypothetical protein